MTTYKIVVTLNDWNIRGDRCNLRSSVVRETSDVVEAGKMLVEHGIPYKEVNHSVMTIVDGTTEVHLIDLYEIIVGKEVFAAQLADENFSINLDDYFRSL